MTNEKASFIFAPICEKEGIASNLTERTRQNQMTSLQATLSGRMHIREIRFLALSEDPEALLSLLHAPEKRTSDNAAWVLTHLPSEKKSLLLQHQQELIDEAMQTSSTAKRRLIMALLENQPFLKDDLRTDFLNFCLTQMTDTDAPTGIRSLAVKLSYAQCRHYPELLAELRSAMELMEQETQKPGLTSVRRRMMNMLAKTTY